MTNTSTKKQRGRAKNAKRGAKARMWALFLSIVAAIGGLATLINNSGIIIKTARQFFAPDPPTVIQGDLLVRQGIAIPKKLQVALLWVPISGNKVSEGSFYQDPETDTIIPSETLHYELALRRQPDSSYLIQERGVDLGTGFIIAFNDIDENGIYSESEDQLVARPQKFVIFRRGEPPTSRNDEERVELDRIRAIPKGFSVAEWDQEREELKTLTTTQIDLDVSPSSIRLFDLEADMRKKAVEQDQMESPESLALQVGSQKDHDQKAENGLETQQSDWRRWRPESCSCHIREANRVEFTNLTSQDKALHMAISYCQQHYQCLLKVTNVVPRGDHYWAEFYCCAG